MSHNDSRSQGGYRKCLGVSGGVARRAVISALALATAATLFGLLGLPSRSASQQEVPTIEPRFTRIFGTDSLEIGSATMSPDGRWIAVTASADGGVVSNLWILPARGGEPTRLTEGTHMDDGPVWFPGSDRIAFRSDRPGPWAIMTLPIDNESGRSIGPPRQVTLEGSQAYFDVSPDGKWIAYTPTNERGNRVIRVVPSTGGTAQTVGEADTPFPIWAPDGQSLYYLVYSGGGPVPVRESALLQVSLDGTTTDTVFTWAGRIRASKFPNGGHVLRIVRGERGKPTLWELATLDGRPLARFALPERMSPREVVKGGSGVLAEVGDPVEPLHILPVDGGPARALTEGRSVDRPLAWTPDGESVLFRTELNGRDVLLLAPVGGGLMRQFQLPEDANYEFKPVFSADGRHMLYATGEPETGPSALKVLSLEDGRTWLLCDASHSAGVAGRGGARFWDGGEFVYVERRGDAYELRASPPQGPSRLVWSFGPDAPDQVGVNGDRILFAKHSEEIETRIYTARVAEGEARELIRFDGWASPSLWSPDGRWIATTHYIDDGSGTGIFDSRVVFLEVSAAGELVGGPRYVGEPMVSYWNSVWLPDSRGIVTTGMDANVWLMSVDPNQKPVALTRDDPNQAWHFVLSPDGRNIAYSSRTSRGSSLWLVDLSEASQVGGN